jgi:hypothetical protein
MTPEGKQKSRVKKILDELGCYYFFPIGGQYSARGVPDIIVCLDGLFVGLEIKAGKNKATALQLREIERIKSAGGFALVVDDSNIDELKELLENLRKRHE